MYKVHKGIPVFLVLFCLKDVGSFLQITLEIKYGQWSRV